MNTRECIPTARSPASTRGKRHEHSNRTPRPRRPRGRPLSPDETAREPSAPGRQVGGAARGGRLRNTRQGAAVDALLEQSKGFRSAQDLHAELRRRGDAVGLTTVYRHLQSLVDGGTVDMLRTEDGEALYRQCETERHHHHLVCRVCGRTVELQGQSVERWAASVASQHGFVDVDHTVEVMGTCPTCATGSVH